MKLSGRASTYLSRRKKDEPEERYFRQCRRRNSGLEIMDNHCLETDRKRRRDFGGKKSKSWVKRSSLWAMKEADHDDE